MPQSLAQIYVHIVFSTKNRQPFLSDRALREDCHSYLAATCNNRGSPALIVGGVEDHVHILCRLSKTESIADLIRELKRESSKALKVKSALLRNLHWQTGYGAFSVSHPHVGPVKTYIATQEEHHKSVTFQDEFRRLLKKNGVEYDERYVWD